jgi:anthranilate phosphoribosyltransferase
MGSADIFEILGVPISLSPLEAKKYFEKHNFVFLFAPLYHPAFKYVAPVRKQLGFPTIFNYLGPFLNPADPSYQIIGMNTLDKMNIVRDAVLGDKKYKKLIVYSSSDGYDEVSSYDITYGYEIEGDYFRELVIDPSRFFKPFPMPKIETREEGLSLFIKGISGEDESLSSLIALNSALGLYALGDVKDLKEGFEKAITAIKEGKVVKKLEELKE